MESKMVAWWSSGFSFCFWKEKSRSLWPQLPAGSFLGPDRICQFNAQLYRRCQKWRGRCPSPGWKWRGFCSMFIRIKIIFSSCNWMTTSGIWHSPGAYYLFFGVNTGGDKLQVPRETWPGRQRAPWAPGTPEGAFVLGRTSLGGSPREPQCQAGVCTHSEGGLAHGTPAHCRPPPVLCADTNIWWSAPGASVQGLAVTPDHRLLFISSECSAQQGRQSDAGMSLLSALGPRRSPPTLTTC